MYQNATEQVNDEKVNSFDLNNLKLILKDVFKYQNIIIYILAFLVSMISIKGQVMPFGLAILAACLGTTVPVVFVFIAVMLSSLIFHSLPGLEFNFLTSIFYFTFVIIFKPRISLEERNEVLKTGIKLFWACFIVTQINNILNIFLIYDFLMGIIISCLTYVFYKIFVNGIVVIRDFNIKKAFTMEELIAAAIIISIASVPFNGITIWGLSITNIILILLLMILGWKNGVLLGGVAGISCGLALSMIGELSPIQIASIAVSGAFAGLLNKFGKIGVIAGFILGNCILTYITNGNSATIIYFREIFISSAILLFIPKNIKLDLEDLVGKDKLLTNVGETRLNSGKEISNKMNAITNSLDDITNKIIEEENDLEDSDSFTQDFLDNLEDYRNNVFYDSLNENEDIIKDMYSMILEKDILVENDLIDIFKKYNIFVVITDDGIKNYIQDIIKIVNRTYKMEQIRRIKLEERKKANRKIEKQLSSVGNIIKTISKDIDNKRSKEETQLFELFLNKGFSIKDVYIKSITNGKKIINLTFEQADKGLKEKDKIINISDLISRLIGQKIVFEKEITEADGSYTQVYSSEDKYRIKVGSSKISKEDSEASGDCNLQIKLEDGKYLLAISDGRGTGRKARTTSRTLLRMLKNLLIAGFDNEKSINLINSSLNISKDEEMYATLDISVLDLYAGKLTSIKNGACNTYIKNKNSIKKIKSNDVPVGVIENVEFNSVKIELYDDDIIVMCSDGLLELKEEEKSDWIEGFLKNVNTNNVQKIADLLVAEAIDKNYGVVKDDITVIVSKISKKK